MWSTAGKQQQNEKAAKILSRTAIDRLTCPGSSSPPPPHAAFFTTPLLLPVVHVSDVGFPIKKILKLEPPWIFRNPPVSSTWRAASRWTLSAAGCRRSSRTITINTHSDVSTQRDTTFKLSCKCSIAWTWRRFTRSWRQSHCYHTSWATHPVVWKNWSS